MLDNVLSHPPSHGIDNDSTRHSMLTCRKAALSKSVAAYDVRKLKRPRPRAFISAEECRPSFFSRRGWRPTTVRQSALIKSTERPLWELITPFRRVPLDITDASAMQLQGTTASAIKADAAALPASALEKRKKESAKFKVELFAKGHSSRRRRRSTVVACKYRR